MKLRHLIAALAVSGLLGPVGSASADELRGGAYVRGKNAEHTAVVLGETVYQVGAHTQILGFDGERLSLGELDMVPELESLERFSRVPTFWVEYDATRVGDRLILNWMQLSAAQEGIDPTFRDEYLKRAPGSRRSRP